MMNVAVAQRGIGYQYDNVIYAQAGGDLNFMALTKAIISRESQWSPNAYRAEPQINDGSFGLMQVLAGTARLFQPAITSAGLFDPATNIIIGTSYLHDLVNRYNDFPSIISAYNAGRPRLDLNQPYVSDVLDYYNWFLQNDPVIQGAIVPPDISVQGEVLTPSSTDYGAREVSPEATGIGGVALLLAAAAGGYVLLGRRR